MLLCAYGSGMGRSARLTLSSFSFLLGYSLRLLHGSRFKARNHPSSIENCFDDDATTT
jgi:hypothetical protein